MPIRYHYFCVQKITIIVIYNLRDKAMFKRIGIAFLLVCAVTSTSARDYTIVEKDTYGTGLYRNGTVVGDHVYVASDLKKFEQFDLNDPTNLVKLPDTSASCRTRANIVTADGNTLAVHCTYTIEFFDISDPENISSIGVHDYTYSPINGFVLEGDRLYMLRGNTEVLVFDATDLSNLVELGRADVGSVTSAEVQKHGDYLYSISSANSFDIYDVSEPASPYKTGSLAAVGTLFYEVEVIGNYAYIGTGLGLQVVDISNKVSPTLVTTVNLDEESNTIRWINTLDYDGTNFVGVELGKNIRTIDISNPSSPTISASKLTFDFRIQDAEINGDSLVLFHGVDGIRTIDISNSNSFVEQGHFTQSIKPFNISLDGDAALISGEGQAYHLIDIDSDLNISERGRIAGYLNFYDGMLDGNTVYVNHNNILSTLDITDIDNPVVTDTDTLDGSLSVSFDYEKSGSQLIVGMFDAIIGVYDFDPLGLTEIANVDIGSDADTGRFRSVLDIVKKGDYLYVTTRETDVTIVDISDPANPSITHHDWISYASYDRQLEVFGNRLFIAGDNGLLVIDITDPSSPKLIETNSEFGSPENIQAIDDRYAVINNFTTLYLVDFEDETAPKIVDEITTDSKFSDIAADLTKILTANRWDSNLRSFQINQAPISNDSDARVDDGLPLTDRVDVSDREDDTLTFSVTQDVSQGSLTLNNDGTYTYQPTANFFGTDSFVYRATDVHGGYSEATVTLEVIDTLTQHFEVDQDKELLAKLLIHSEDQINTKFKLMVAPTNGKVKLKRDGRFHYVPKLGFTGEDSFQFVTSNRIEFSDVQYARINVVPVD